MKAKSMNKTLTVLVLALALVSMNSFAQRGRGVCDGTAKGERRGMRSHDGQGQGMGEGICKNIPGLTEEQQAKIDKSRIAFQKELHPLQNQLREKKAHLQTLSETDNPDRTAIDKTIDEIAGLQGQMMKRKNAHHQEIRTMLTDEQKLWFDKKDDRPRGKGKVRRNSCPRGAR